LKIDFCNLVIPEHLPRREQEMDGLQSEHSESRVCYLEWIAAMNSNVKPRTTSA
jgi:hypothetical protein